MNENQRALPSIFVAHPKIRDEQPSKFCWIGTDGCTTGRIDLSAADPYDMLIEDSHFMYVSLV